MSVDRPHVVILGAGFAGLYAAKDYKSARVRVTVMGRRNHHLFQPLLYQVATAGLSAIDIGAPIRQILRRQDNATVLMAETARVDPEAKRVGISGGGAVDFDYLIVATGVTDWYFGHDDWAQHAPGLKTIEDAL